MKFGIKCLLAFILLHNLCYAKIIMRFQPSIDVTASQLGDLIIIKNDKHHWSKLPLQSHPMPLEIITKDAIISWITLQQGNVSVSWQGKKSTVVQALKSTTAGALLEKAGTALVHQLAAEYSETEITPLSLVKNSHYSLDSFKVEVTTPYPVPRRLCVWLINDKQRIAVWFKIKAYAPVLVANHDISYDKPVQKTAFSIKRRDIAGLKSAPVQSFPDNCSLKSSIKQGQILLAKQLKKTPMVIHGQLINVSVQKNGLTVVMTALAITDGYPGETITVKNTVTQQSFNAIVRGTRQAEILA